MPRLLLELVALVGGTIHPMSPGAEPALGTVLIDGGLIVAVGPDVEAPGDVRRIDVTGMHLIPGLIDGLAYHDPVHDFRYTEAGVTLIRDHGNDLARIFELRSVAVRDAMLGPALSISGAVLDGSPPSTGSAIVLEDVHAVHQMVPVLLKEGPDFLAVQVGLPHESWREVLRLAHEPDDGARLQVWGPVPEGLALEAVLEAGQDGLLFLDGFLPEDATWETLDFTALEPLLARVVASGCRITPLLRGTARAIETQDGDAAELLWLGPLFAGQWRADLDLRAELLADPAYAERGRAVLAAQRELVRRLHAAGAVLVPGSGAPHPWLMPGRGLHEELREFVAAGIEPTAALELATAGAARALGLADRGTLEPGKVADVVALRSDPREGLAALEQVEMICLRGNVLMRSELDARREQLDGELETVHRRLTEPIEVAEPIIPDGAVVVLRGTSETSMVAGRIASERWAIAREPDGSIAFSGRRVIPMTSEDEQVEVATLQRLRKGKLEGFEIRLRNSSGELTVRGVSVAGQMRVERRIDGRHIDTKGVREELAAVDSGSITAYMLLAHTREPGFFPVLRFDQGLELEVVRWDLALDDGGAHVFKTPTGIRVAGFLENGAPRVLVEQSGSDGLTTQSVVIDNMGGPGLPLPEAKRALLRAAAKADDADAAEAGAPAQDGAGDDQ